MQKLRTYFIRRNGKSVWLSQNEPLLDSDIVLEERELTVVEDGKILINDSGEIIGNCFWNRNNQKLIEIDSPEETKEEEDG